MCTYRSIVVSLSFAVTLSACGGGGGSSDSSSGGSSDNNVAALSCTGNRVWDAGESDVVEDALSLISETNGGTFENSRFPCTIFWEFNPTENCSVGFSYEDFLVEFSVPDQLDVVETTGDNLTVTFSNDEQDTFPPANISLAQLNGVPDCVFTK